MTRVRFYNAKITVNCGKIIKIANAIIIKRIRSYIKSYSYTVEERGTVCWFRWYIKYNFCMKASRIGFVLAQNEKMCRKNNQVDAIYGDCKFISIDSINAVSNEGRIGSLFSGFLLLNIDETKRECEMCIETGITAKRSHACFVGIEKKKQPKSDFFFCPMRIIYFLKNSH